MSAETIACAILCAILTGPITMALGMACGGVNIPSYCTYFSDIGGLILAVFLVLFAVLLIATKI